VEDLTCVFLAKTLKPGNGLLGRHRAPSCASSAPKRKASLSTTEYIVGSRNTVISVAHHQAARHHRGEAALHAAAEAGRE